jgi:hypothetical protein
MIRREITSLGFAEARAWPSFCPAVLVTISPLNVSSFLNFLHRLCRTHFLLIFLNDFPRAICLFSVGDFRNCNLSLCDFPAFLPTASPLT